MELNESVSGFTLPEEVGQTLKGAVDSSNDELPEDEAASFIAESDDYDADQDVNDAYEIEESDIEETLSVDDDNIITLEESIEDTVEDITEERAEDAFSSGYEVAEQEDDFVDEEVLETQINEAIALDDDDERTRNSNA
jgi:hypothetical protein